MNGDVTKAMSGKRMIALVGGAICGVAAFAGAGAGAAPAPPPGSADLAVVKSDSPDPVQVGGLLTYRAKVSNFGPDTAPAVVLTDKIPSATDFVSATSTRGTCKAKGNKVSCTIGDLTADATDPYLAKSSATVTIKVKAPAKPDTISNTASATSDADDPHPANNSDTEATRVVAGPSAPRCGGVEATIVGTSKGEVIEGTSGRDVILAGGGDDRVFSGRNNDLICAGAGADLVRGGGGADTIRGGHGHDRLGGEAGDDTVRGQGRGDRLRGGAGDDRLAGGSGRDRCRGGAGADTLRSCEK